jgi:hypothetical protein
MYEGELNPEIDEKYADKGYSCRKNLVSERISRISHHV